MKETFILFFLLAISVSGIESQQWPGAPQRIIEFPIEGTKIVANNAELNGLLGREEVKDRKIVAVSIVGPFRKGKSFLLNYFLRYLYFTYKSVASLKNNFQYKPSNGKWIGLPGEPLTGFSWRKGVDRETDGIVMWSDVFLYDDETSGEKFAIVLIDTQGLFDHNTPIEINGKIFSFTTLMSSIQIFNLPNIIHENELEYLQFATEYAKFSISNENLGKPFEHLLFLVRDWVNDDEYSFGFEGGSKYLEEKVLSTSGKQKGGMIQMRESIKNSFDKLSCFLLPHPGEVVQRSKFVGRWASLNEDFVKQLEVLVPRLLSPENLKAKKINGVNATVSQYLLNLSLYVKNFSNSKIPSAQTVFESSVALYMKQLVERILSSYNKEMSQQLDNFKTYKESDDAHLKCREKAINEYLKQKKMGTATHANFYRNKLIEDINNAYIELSKTVSIQIQNRLMKAQIEELKRVSENSPFSTCGRCSDQLVSLKSIDIQQCINACISLSPKQTQNLMRNVFNAHFSGK